MSEPGWNLFCRNNKPRRSNVVINRVLANLPLIIGRDAYTIMVNDEYNIITLKETRVKVPVVCYLKAVCVTVVKDIPKLDALPERNILTVPYRINLKVGNVTPLVMNLSIRSKGFGLIRGGTNCLLNRIINGVHEILANPVNGSHGLFVIAQPLTVRSK